MPCYTYLLYNGDKFYIGSRCKNNGLTPEEDYDYLGSPTDIEYRNSIKCKTILRVFDTPQGALHHEIQLHNFHNVGVNPKFANRSKQTSTGFSTAGIPPSEETKRKISEVHKSRLRPPRSEETKRKLSIANKGENNPNYDCTIRHWINKDGREEFMTKYNLRVKYDLQQANVSRVANGKQKSTNGWSLKK